jgi:hypothetical protein
MICFTYHQLPPDVFHRGDLFPGKIGGTLFRRIAEIVLNALR